VGVEGTRKTGFTGGLSRATTYTRLAGNPGALPSPRKIEFGIGGDFPLSWGLPAFFSLFVVDILSRSQFLRNPLSDPTLTISMQITNYENHIFKIWGDTCPQAPRGSYSDLDIKQRCVIRPG